MQTEVKSFNNISCAVVNSREVIINNIQSVLDFIMSIQYDTKCDRVALNKQAIAEDFFVLSTGMAGDILQKFVTYKVKLAIFGDFSAYTSKPLKDFIYESNKGNHIFFVATEQEAVEKLTDI